jgi:class 3 adenylate cyclase
MSDGSKKQPETKLKDDHAEMTKEMARLKHDLKQALDRQTATEEILRVISNSTIDPQPVFEAIVQAGRGLFPDTAISVAHKVDGEVHLLAIAGTDPEFVESWRHRYPFPVQPDYMHGDVILEGKIVDVPDVEKALDKYGTGGRNFLASGYRAVTMMPIFLGDETFGVLAVVRLSPGPLSREQFAVLQTFAAQANIAIENTHLVNEMRHTNESLATVSDQLAKYISPQLYESIISGKQRVAIETKRKKLTIFFSDIANFTEITDQLEAEDLTALLNQYLTEMSIIAQEHGAYFDKFIGDAMMFFFGDLDSKSIKEDATACVRMAIAMQRRLAQLQVEWRERGLIDQPFETRMGINTGYCTIGNFGSEDRMDYTIIGGEVNLAARLEANADAGGILMEAETYALVKDWLLAEERGAISMKGFANPIRTFSVKGIYEDLAADGQVIFHEKDGLTITIDRDQVDKNEAIRVLEETLAKLKK